MSVDVERDFWNRVAEATDVSSKWIADKNLVLQDCIDAIMPSLVEAEDILEIGCGIGRLTRPLQQLLPDTGILGIDISEKLVHIADELSSNYPKPVHAVCDGRRIPLPNGAVDAVYSMQVFQHLRQDGVQSYIKEAHRVLRPGGFFRFQYVKGSGSEGPMAHNYTNELMKKWLTEVGFEIIKLDEDLIYQDWSWITARRQDGTKTI